MKSKIFSQIFILFVCTAQSYAQINLEARYKVLSPLTLKGEAGNPINFTLEYEAIIFSKGNKSLLYLRPLFLDDYPEGSVVVSYPGGISRYTFSTDSIYMPELINTDSQKVWTCVNYPGNAKLNEYFIMDYNKKNNSANTWRVLSETKNINGIECQRAKLFIQEPDGILKESWDIWFNPKQYFPFYFFGIKNSPGFIVEATFLQNNMHFQLISLETSKHIPATTFWPTLFENAKFNDYSRKLSATEKKQKGKNNKRLEIMAQ